MLWEHTGSNRGPSACKADALNQLSYAPFFNWECKDNRLSFPSKFFLKAKAVFFIIFEYNTFET